MSVTLPPDLWLSLGGKLLEYLPAPGRKERQERTRAFYEQLTGALTDILAPYRHIDTTSLSETRKMAQLVLRAINAVVYKYRCYDGSCGDLQINSCYMVPVLRHEFTSGLLENIRFVDRKRAVAAELRAVLELLQWAVPVPGLPHDLCLPVEDASHSQRYRYLLFGAPRAFEKKTLQIVDDTLKHTRYRYSWRPWVADGPAVAGKLFLQKELPAGLVEELTHYFRQHQDHVRSFISIPLDIPPEDVDRHPQEYRDLPLAVLNIQANRPRLFGRRGALARNLLNAMLPMLGVLARYISRVRLLTRNGQLENIPR